MADAGVKREGQVLLLSGPVNLASVPALHAACLPAAGAEGLAVDLAGATSVDSSALAMLMDLRRIVETAGGHFEVRHPPPALGTLADLYGVGFLVENRVPDA